MLGQDGFTLPKPTKPIEPTKQDLEVSYIGNVPGHCEGGTPVNHSCSLRGPVSQALSSLRPRLTIQASLVETGSAFCCCCWSTKAAAGEFIELSSSVQSLTVEAREELLRRRAVVCFFLCVADILILLTTSGSMPVEVEEEKYLALRQPILRRVVETLPIRAACIDNIILLLLLEREW